MRTDPLRVAGWCVVMLAAAVFMLAVKDITDDVAVPPIVPPTAGRSINPPSPPAAVHYVGNTNRKKFHALTCKYATCPNCTARFTTREDAIASGYSPGGCCKP